MGMKLRLESGTIKLRLSREEIRKLEIEKSIKERIPIDGLKEFEYGVRIIDTENLCKMHFSNDGLHISIPSGKADKWLQSNQIGIRECISVAEDKEVLLIVEEDLPPRQKDKK